MEKTFAVELSPVSFAHFRNHPDELTGIFPQGTRVRLCCSESAIENTEEIALPQEVIETNTAGSVVEDTSSQRIEEISQGGPRDEDFDETNKSVWLESTTKLLLALIAEIKPKVGKSTKYRTKKKMYNEIRRRMVDDGHNYSVVQIENKYRALERRHKEVKLNNKESGRARQTHPYEREMEDILRDNAAVNPEHLLENEDMEPLQDADVAHTDEVPSESSSTCATTDRTLAPRRQQSISFQLSVLANETREFRQKMLQTFKEGIDKRDQRAQERNEIFREILNKISK